MSRTIMVESMGPMLNCADGQGDGWNQPFHLMFVQTIAQYEKI